MIQKVRAIIFFILCFPPLSFGQNSDEQLANYYYINGDCEKAIPYFEKVFENNASRLVFNRYVDCLEKEQGTKATINIIKKQIKNFPDEYDFSVMLGQAYEKLGDEKNAAKTYNYLIESMQPISRNVINVQKAFSKVGKYELALSALERGRKILKGYPLNMQFAEVYGELGRVEEMIDEYLSLLDYNSSMIHSLQRLMPRMIDFEAEESEAYEILKRSLIRRVQKQPNDIVYAEMLIWSFTQRKDFSSALIHAKALDKRTSKDGREVFNLGKISSSNKDYPTARKAFQYVVELGNDYPFYYAAEQLLLNTRFLEVTTNRNYSQEELTTTIEEYENALNRVGKNAKAVNIILELAQIMAFYAGQPQDAKELLLEAMEYRGVSSMAKAELKVLLADIYVILDDIWEASLLYMQVEKDFKYEPIGFEAKYKNARVFYYDGDFIWAQSQLDVLKESTSKLIANDAMKLSIFITDNLGLDSNLRAMRKFANADLLIAQRRFDEAFILFDSIQMIFPYHSLADDILMRKAEAYYEQGKWGKAIEKYELVLARHADDIFADDALFQMAVIYEDYLFQPDKAKDLYFRLLKEYKGSLYVTEARKRFRALQESL